MLKLTDEEKVEVLYYVVGVYALAGVDEYADIKNFPTPKDKTMEPDHVLISNLLDLDFQKDVYDNKELFEFCNQKPKRGFIGDDLTQAVCDFTSEVRKNNTLIDMDLVNKLSETLNTIYSSFKFIYDNQHLVPKNSYVESGVEFNGEKLYKKVTG